MVMPDIDSTVRKLYVAHDSKDMPLLRRCVVEAGTRLAAEGRATSATPPNEPRVSSWQVKAARAEV
jgi:hypothetical protein